MTDRTISQRIDAVEARLDAMGCSAALADQSAKLAAIRRLAQQHAIPAVNPGAHELAGKILAILGGNQ